jgi:hypothetical protein
VWEGAVRLIRMSCATGGRTIIAGDCGRALDIGASVGEGVAADVGARVRWWGCNIAMNYAAVIETQMRR